MQVDVVAINWQSREILLGECKWGQKKIGKTIVDDLVNRKREKVVLDLTDSGEQWRFHFALFAQAPLTSGASQLVKENGVTVVDLVKLHRDLTPHTPISDNNLA